MRRRHLVEIEDAPWCPAALRDAATDYLQFVIELGQPYGPLAPRLAAALAQSGSQRIVDLCSGGGGPWRSMRRLLAEGENCPVDVRLTDKFPNAIAARRVDGDPQIAYHDEGVDATAVPAALDGFRTLFSSFHHFRPEQARQILRDAVDKRQGIAIAEVTERSWRAILLMLVSPLLVWLVTPFIRPRRMSRLIFTYFLPFVPLLVVFDGIVSCLRTYTPDELREMVDALDAPDYVWEIGQLTPFYAPAPITYLIGHPRPAPARACERAV